MNSSTQFVLVTAISIVMVTGCAKSPATPAAVGIAPNVHLSQEPAGAVEVLDAATRQRMANRSSSSADSAAA